MKTKKTVPDPQMGGNWAAVPVMAEHVSRLNPGTRNEH